VSEAVAAAPPAGRPWGRAAAWLAFLGPFFFASYGFATWFTAERAGVGAIVFDWERAIPFAPWTIVPYWSIDFLYGVSLFVCADRRELDMHAKRLLTAQLIAVSMFLLFPLRFTFDRPDADGMFGSLFDFLAMFDKPFNQAPSLHVALLVILWALFASKLGSLGRLLLDAWFALIAVSVLTTWQHHFIDIPTGALLGFFCLWLWPREEPSPPSIAHLTQDPTRRRLALRYALGSLAAGAIALSVGGAALWLLWVTVALALVAVNYALLGPAGFQKYGGQLSPATTVLFAPYLGGALVNAWAWTRKRPSPDHIVDGVWIGRLPTRRDLERGDYDAVIDVTCELPLNHGTRAYANPAMLDLTLPERATLAAAVQAIERHRPAGGVLVCCALGYSRSATVVAAWLVATGRAPDAEAAVAHIRAARPQVVLTDAHVATIAAFGDRR